MDNSIEDTLFIKQSAILEIIREQKLVTFDHIRRQFFALNHRTLRYHLKKLQDKGLIRKKGVTRGVFYEAIDIRNIDDRL